MSNRHLLLLALGVALAGCERPDPIEPIASASAPVAGGTPAPVTDPATAPAPAGTMPTAPTPAGTVSTDPAPPAPDAPPAGLSATVTLQPRSGRGASGVVDLTLQADGVRLEGRLTGLGARGPHGLHIHETGDCSAADAASAGAHFNPGGDAHGAYGAEAHHAGDLPSAIANDQGEADIDLIVRGLEIGSGGPRDIIGRALVVHAQPDDFRTQPDGAAGARIGCGVIVRR